MPKCNESSFFLFFLFVKTCFNPSYSNESENDTSRLPTEKIIDLNTFWEKKTILKYENSQLLNELDSKRIEIKKLQDIDKERKQIICSLEEEIEILKCESKEKSNNIQFLNVKLLEKETFAISLEDEYNKTKSLQEAIISQ